MADYYKRCDECGGTGCDPAGCNCSDPGPQYGHEPGCGACEFCWDAKQRRSTGYVPVPAAATDPGPLLLEPETKMPLRLPERES